jgi:succinate dehydrogenase/fumarate reductase cytochrome b subunit
MAEELIAVNVTNSVASGMSNVSGWFIAFIVFIITIACLFFIIKGLRKIVYGSIVMGILFGVYKFSRWVGLSTQEGNTLPIKYFAGIIGFIILAFVVGHFITKLKFIKNLEEGIEFKGEDNGR